MQEKQSRRQFVKGTLGLLGGVITARMAGLFPEAQPLLAQTRHNEIPFARPVQEDIAQLYDGFVIFNDIDTPLPNNVRYPPSIDLHSGTSSIFVTFNTIGELAEYVPFPLFVLATLPDDNEFISGEVVEFADTKDIYEARIIYGSYPANQDIPNINFIISAKYGYIQPFPIWPSRGLQPLPENESLTLPEKVTFTPRPGILLPNATGYQVHWLQDKVAYTLLAEYEQNQSVVEQLTRSLVEI